MKSLFLLGAFVLTSYVVSAQSFTMVALQNSDTISVSETVKYSIAIIVQDGFNQTVFLSAVPTSPFMGAITFSDSTPNPPYTNISLTIRPSIQDTGVKTFILTGKNGNVQSTLILTLTTLKNPQWAILNGPQGLRLVRDITLKKDIGGDICVSTYKSGDPSDKLSIHHYRNQEWETETFSPGFNLDPYDYITYNYDKKGVLWFGTTKGLGRYDGIFTSLFNSTNSGFVMNPIETVQHDKNDLPVCFAHNRYYGRAYETSIVYYDGTIWKSHNRIITNSDDKAYWVSRFCIDSSNRIWIPTRGGIIRIQDSVQQSITVQSNPPIWNNDVDNIICDKDGDIWCMYNYNSMTIAFSHYDGTTWRHINTPTNKSLFTFIIDDDKNIWAGSEEGLHKYDGTAWTTYNKNNSPLTGGVKTIIMDKNKNIWTHINQIGEQIQKFYIFNPGGINGIPIAPLDIEEQPKAMDNIQIFPNPASTSLSISGIVGASSLRVLNGMGVEVLITQTVSENAQIDVSSLPSGLYFVNVRTATGAVVKPIVVSH